METTSSPPVHRVSAGRIEAARGPVVDVRCLNLLPLGHARDDLKRQRNRLRQEEIVEEIELMVCGEPGIR